MKITLVGFKNEFTSETGSGIRRYAFEMKNNMPKQAKQKRYDISTFEINPILGNERALTLFLGAHNFLLFNKLKTDIFHFISHNPAINGKLFKKEGRSKVTIATGIEFGYVKCLDTNKIGYSEFIPNKYDVKSFLVWQILQKNLLGTLNADFLIAISSQTRNEAIELGFKKENIYLVSLGVDNRFFRNSHHKTNKYYTVGYIGNFRPRKNLKFAIESFKLLGKEFKFEIWGNKNNYFEEMRKLSGTNKMIQFKGFAPEREIVNIYDSFDVFVFPTLYEGFGIPIFEAQARGLPVVIYKYGKVPKEVRKYCFEAEDPEHMAQIISNLKENGYDEKLKKKSTEYARSFTWEKTAKETIDVYEKVYNN